MNKDGKLHRYLRMDHSVSRLFLSIQKKNQTEWRNVDETPFRIDLNRRELMDYDYMRDVFAHCGVQIIKN